MKQEIIENYLNSISLKFTHEETSEMGYRTDFENLLKKIFESINVTRFDHDAKAKLGNKPDFVVIKNDIPILYIETKDIGTSLNKIEKSEQMSRYYGYTNLILTDYLEFRFYRNGLHYEEQIKIAEYDVSTRTIIPKPLNYEYLTKTILDFTISQKEPIRSGSHLAKIMGGKAQRIRDNVRYILEDSSKKDQDLIKLYEAVKSMLVHDLTTHTFSDMYAQTMVYGLFVARYYDKTPGSFSRAEARELIPNSNRFLKHFFDHIVGVDFKSSLKFIVDELCEVYSYADIGKLMEDYFKTSTDSTNNNDPVIHFYEDFLQEYDPELRKKMGAYYTPQPVVNFIIKSVDYILKKDFNLEKGISDASRLPNGKHKVQILDPAAGTGTFISTIINEIYETFKKNNQLGRWFAYVHNDLLPRIHGFELMMAPYTIAHLRLGIEFRKKGFWDFHRRLGIYLTNSLENDHIKQLPMAFGLAESIAEESKEAAVIKNETPIMVIVGNPPYSASSSNKGEWIQKLVNVYKTNLVEKSYNALSDDYVKFIRLAEHFIEKNKTGIVAMITNNSFIDGIVHRQMRKHLLETFDNIYILDLHGSSKKSEKTPDSGKDENVFDIQQSVSINLFVKKTVAKNNLGRIYHADLFGKREQKYHKLNEYTSESIIWKELKYSDPYYFFIPKDFGSADEYHRGFDLKDLFVEYGSGIKFRKDNLLVKNHFSAESVSQLLNNMKTQDNSFLYSKYNFKDTSDWRLNNKRKLFIDSDFVDIRPVLYRPFDVRYTYYPLDKISEIIPRGDSRKNLMQNFIFGENFGLVTKRGQDFPSAPCLVTKTLIDMRVYSPPGVQGTDSVFPLYVYINNEKCSNFRTEVIDKIQIIIGETSPEDIFDYIYAVLNSSIYQEKYSEFLKIDFPRVPYPKDTKIFKKLVELGRELRQLHLLESPKINEFITIYPESGTDIVEIPVYRDGKVYINDKQYFGNVPEIAWNFYIGGYQPAQKWLKDRKGRVLTNSDLEHYQKIIVALVETSQIKKNIDQVISDKPTK